MKEKTTHTKNINGRDDTEKKQTIMLEDNINVNQKQEVLRITNSPCSFVTTRTA
jgi:hypothetical protein